MDDITFKLAEYAAEQAVVIYKRLRVWRAVGIVSIVLLALLATGVVIWIA